MTTDKVKLLGRAEVLGYPFVIFGGSEHLAGEDAWRRKLPDLLPGHLAEITPQLDAHEMQQRRRDEAEDRMAEGDARRAAALVPDPALAEELRREAEVAQVRHEANRPERMEAHAQRTVELLEKLVASLERR